MTYILSTAITVICTSVLFTLMKYFSPRKQIETKDTLPKISEKWWNSDNKMTDEMKMSNRTIRPYEVSFSQEVIEDLRNLLNSTRLDHSDNYNSLQKIIDYWKNDYDFEKRVRYINKYMHFTTNIQGLDIHFVHVKPTYNEIEHGQKRILPLLMLHGWPSSILEFYKFIPLLITPRKEYDFVFEVIIPSLPGFGFSSVPTLDGFSCADMSVVLKNLMLRLGHNQFYVQSSNWNAFIACIMSSLFPEHVLKICISISASLITEIYPSYSYLAECNKQLILLYKQYVDMKRSQIEIQKELCRIECILRGSPVDLAAYINDKILIWTNYSEINDEFLQKYSLDDLIDNLMIYWTSKSIIRARRTFGKQFIELKSEFLEELINTRKVKASFSFGSLFFGNILKISAVQELPYPYTIQNGGFPALEEPDHFVDDIWAIIGGRNVQQI